MIILIIILFLFWYNARYYFSEEDTKFGKHILVDDYIVSYTVVRRPHNIREDIFMYNSLRNIGEEYIYNSEAGETYGFPFVFAKAYKIKSRNDFVYFIFEMEDGLKLVKFNNIYPFPYAGMEKTTEEADEARRGIHKTIFSLIYNVNSYEDIKSVSFTKAKNTDDNIRVKKKTFKDKDTLEYIYNLICGLNPISEPSYPPLDELGFDSGDVDWSLMVRDMTVTLKSGEKITFYYNSIYRSLREYGNEDSQISNEANTYLMSLAGIEH